MTKREPKPQYAEAAERFLALMAARRMSKTKLSRESGAAMNKLAHYETGQRAPGDVFRSNSEFKGLASALMLLPSTLVAWWAFGEDHNMPGHLREDIDRFRTLSAKERLETLQFLGWQLGRGGHRGRAAPPRAE